MRGRRLKRGGIGSTYTVAAGIALGPWRSGATHPGDGEGYEVLVACDGPSAVHLATTIQPDVVLLDIDLPGIDGYAVASTLRQRLGHTASRIIAITGCGQPESRERSKAAGFDLHRVNPIDFEGLRGVLAAYRRLSGCF